MTISIILAILGWVGFGWTAYKWGEQRAELEATFHDIEIYVKRNKELDEALNHLTSLSPDELREKVDSTLRDRGIT